jgi:hypothetical protein
VQNYCNIDRPRFLLILVAIKIKLVKSDTFNIIDIDSIC